MGFGDGYGYRFASDRGRFVLQSSGAFGWYTLELGGAAVSGLSAADALSLEQFTSHTRIRRLVGVGDRGRLRRPPGAARRLRAYGRLPEFQDLVLDAVDRHRPRRALWAVDMFVDEVEDASPYAAPVLRFLLEGALQYGFYELRKEEVHWPFDTEPPLDYNMFKLGLTTRF